MQATFFKGKENVELSERPDPKIQEATEESFRHFQVQSLNLLTETIIQFNCTHI